MSTSADLARKQFEYVQREILSPLKSNDVRIAAVPLSCVRLFDSTMMRSILSVTKPELFGRWDIQDFGNLLIKFKSSGLIVWGKGYSLANETRHLISQHLLYNENTVYRKAHKAALEVYDDWLARPVNNRNLFVQEELYHNASLNGDSSVERVLISRLDKYPEWYRDDQRLALTVDGLRNEISSDSELAQLTTRIPQLLGLIDAFAK